MSARAVVSTLRTSEPLTGLGSLTFVGGAAYMAADERIVRVDKAGAVTAVAGSATEHGCTDADVGAGARFNSSGMEYGALTVIGADAGLLYVRDPGCGIRTVDLATGATDTLTDVAGSDDYSLLPHSTTIAGRTLYSLDQRFVEAVAQPMRIYARDLGTGQTKMLVQLPEDPTKEMIDVIVADDRYVWAFGLWTLHRIDRATGEHVDMTYPFGLTAHDLTYRRNAPYFDGQVASVGEYLYFVITGGWGEWKSIGRINKTTGERSVFATGVGTPQGNTDYTHYSKDLSYLSGLATDGTDLYISEYSDAIRVVRGAMKMPPPPPPAPEPENLRKLDALEVTQSVQDLDNSVPLVADKPTVVRADLSTPGDPVLTSGRLRGFAGGRELPGSPLTAVKRRPRGPGRRRPGQRPRCAGPGIELCPARLMDSQGQTELALELPGGVSCPGAVSGPTMLSGPHWHLNVQTPKTWAATTQIFRITLVDGSTYEAEFTLK